MDEYQAMLHDMQQEEDSHSCSLANYHYSRHDRHDDAHPYRPQNDHYDAPSYSRRPSHGQFSRHRTPAPTHVEPNLYVRQDVLLEPYDRDLLVEPRTYRQRLASTDGAPLTLLPRPPSVRPTIGAQSSLRALQLSRISTYEASMIPPRHSSSTLLNEGQQSLDPRSYSGRFSYNRPSSSCGYEFSSSPFRAHDSPTYGVSQRRGLRESRQTLNTSIRDHPLSNVSSSQAQPSVALPRRAAPNLAAPVIQGIHLVSLNELPDRFRSVFPFPLFNAVQSKCYNTIYKTNDNLVLSAPTGSGKTAVLEIAICRLVAGFQSDQYKIIYMAPTKSLCSERQRDWQPKFTSLDLQCAELTGDTDQAQLRNVQNANIIITTPEKWDSMTRKWKDQAKLLQLVKLFLIDEVHILKDTRGATLEAVVSRMTSVGTNVRFIALSATVPNSDDIATWLGKNHTNRHLPAQMEKFGEEFRPVKLQKFVYGLPFRGNDFAFEGVCDQKLPEIIAKHSHKKPIMVFCFTRKSTSTTAKLLANLWTNKSPRDRQWTGPSQKIEVSDPELKSVITAGVAFHHGGLDGYDRQAVERSFLEGQINVICCTTTLAVGVNLPCHLVIVKNTVSWQDDGVKEYADLEMMQMLGRAGRPQFDDSAIAVIITKQDKVKKYEKLVSGEELLESCLHLNLIDHLNAEIGLGTIYDLHTAKRWLAGTFLYVRLGQNPGHYNLDGDSIGRNIDDRIEQICKRDISLLQNVDLVCTEGRLRCTEFGDAMARYYVKFETMKILLQLTAKAKMSEILSALCQAEEFHEVRFRSGEKNLLRVLNSANGVRFPIKIDIALSAQKRSIILQAELGGIDFPAEEQYTKHKKQYQQDRAILFTNIHRLIRCVIDCQVHRQDAPATRHALELARSLGARVWDNSPLQMKQIPMIGLVAVRKLAVAGINSLEALEEADAQRIEMLLSKNVGFGSKIVAGLRAFPKLRVSVKLMGKYMKQGEPVTIKIKADLGFLNDKIPTIFIRKPIFVCFLAERSDGHLVDFRRISAKKLGGGQDVLLSADLFDEAQYITCYVMCDEIAGTMRYAELKPGLAASMFSKHIRERATVPSLGSKRPCMNISRRRTISGLDFCSASALFEDDQEFSDNNIEDEDMMAAADGLDFSHIETFETTTAPINKSSKAEITVHNKHLNEDCNRLWEPRRLENGKWACNHRCKDKNVCKHMCCHDGLEKPPKPPKKTSASGSVIAAHQPEVRSVATNVPGQDQLNFSINKPVKRPKASHIEVIDLASTENIDEYAKSSLRAHRNLHNLHESIVGSTPARTLTPTISFSKNSTGLELNPSRPRKLDIASTSLNKTSSDYGDKFIDDLPSPSALLGESVEDHNALPASSSDDHPSTLSEEGLSELEAGMVGLKDPFAPYEWSEGSHVAAISPGRASDLHTNIQGQTVANLMVDSSLQNTRFRSTPSIRVPNLDNPREEERLFFTTSSLGNQAIADVDTGETGKRKHETPSPSADASLDHAGVVKKQKVAPDVDSRPLKPSISWENQAVAEKSPHPKVFADMDGIDADLLAEFADIVEFV